MNSALLDLPFPIKTPRLLLRPPKNGDAVALNDAIVESFDMLNQHMAWAKKRPSIEESEIFVKQTVANWILKKNEEPYLPIFIFDKITDVFIGATGFHHFNWNIPSVEIGYWVRKSYSGKGLMTEAVNALTQYGFRELRCKRIEIRCDILNERSKKLASRLKFSHEATLKNHRLSVSGKVSDSVIFARYDLDDLPSMDVTW